jgi:hypothetical protein
MRVWRRINFHDSRDGKAGKQDSEKSGRKPCHRYSAKSQNCTMKPSPLSAFESKICDHFQNKIPFQWMKMLKTVGCTLQQK